MFICGGPRHLPGLKQCSGTLFWSENSLLIHWWKRSIFLSLYYYLILPKNPLIIISCLFVCLPPKREHLHLHLWRLTCRISCSENEPRLHPPSRDVTRRHLLSVCKDGDDGASSAHLRGFGRFSRSVEHTAAGRLRWAGAAHSVDKRRVSHVVFSCVFSSQDGFWRLTGFDARTPC